jgi:hypothetical protein
VNKYIAFYKSDELTVEAETSHNAQTAAFNILRDKYPRRKIKAYEITVVLAEINGKEVIHDPASLG